ncbi:MAG: hypothetical protein KY475_24600 [Planctomycetes bacterium]|nr:hypothetical protein [Planctomycetota bacterium]
MAVAAILALGVGVFMVSVLSFALLDFGPRPSDEEIRAAFLRISNLDPDLVELRDIKCTGVKRHSHLEGQERLEVHYTATLHAKAEVLYGPSDTPWKGALSVWPYSAERMWGIDCAVAPAGERFSFPSVLVFGRVRDEPWRHLSF